MANQRGEVVLSEREARVFDALVRSHGQPVSRDVLRRSLDADTDRAVDYAVRRIRIKLQTQLQEDDLVTTVQGIGYRLDGMDAPSAPGAPVLSLPDRTVNLTTGAVQGPGATQTLTGQQRALLVRLVDADGATLSRAALLRDVWGSVNTRQLRLVDGAIRQLRQVLEADPSRPRYLETERGAGYRLRIPSRLSNLPQRSWAGVPRDELDAVLAHVRSDRWVTLTGPVGIGKSWLALQIAHDLKTTLPGGAWWVDAVGCDSEPELIRRVADAMDVHTQSTADALCLALATRPERLMVLDGLPPDGSADGLIRRLITHTSLRVLVTSLHQPFALDNRHHPVGPLTREEAVSLFMALVELGGADDAPPHDIAAQLCATVRFNPRAIELLVQEGLRGGFDPTETSVGTRAVATLMRDSLAALAPPARRVLIELGVFSDEFTRPDAVAIGQATSPALDDLVARQLVRVTRPGWMRVDPTTRDVLDAPSETARRRHAEHHEALAIDAVGHFRTSGGARARRVFRRRASDALQAVDYWLTSEARQRCIPLLTGLMHCSGDALPGAFERLERALEGPAFPGRAALWVEYAGSRRIDVDEARRALDSARDEGVDERDFAYRYACVLLSDRVGPPAGEALGPEPTTHPDQVDWLIANAVACARTAPDTALHHLARARLLATRFHDSTGLLQVDYAVAHVWYASMLAPQTAAAHYARLRPRFVAEGRMHGAAACAFRAADAWLETGEVDAAVEALDWVDEVAVHLPLVRAMAYPDLVRLRAQAHTMEPTELVQRSIEAAAAQVARGEVWFAANFQILTRIGWARLGDLRAAVAEPGWPKGHSDIDMILAALRCALDAEVDVPVPHPAHWPMATALVRAARDGTTSGTPVVDAIAALARTHRLQR